MQAGADSVTRRLAGGLGMQAVVFVLLTVGQVLLVPVFLSRWSMADYSAWITVFALAGLSAMADAGLHGCLVSRLRAAIARGDGDAARRWMAQGFAVYALLVSGALLLLLLCRPMLPELLESLGVGGAGWTGTAMLLAASHILLLPRGLPAALYSARGDYAGEGRWTSLLLAGQLLAQAGALLAGAGPAGVALAYLMGSLLFGWGFMVAHLARHHADMLVRPAWPGRAVWRDMLGRAPLFFLPQLSRNALTHLPLVLLARLTPDPTAVVAFAMHRTYTGLARQAAQQSLELFGLESLKRLIQGDRTGLRRSVIGNGRFSAAVLGLAAGLLLPVGSLFFSHWTHGQVPFDPWLAAAFLLPLALAPLSGVRGLLVYHEKPRPQALALLAQMLGGLALCAAAIPGLGALGAAVGLAAAEMVTLGWLCLWAATRVLHLPLHGLLLPGVVALAGGLVWGGGVAVGLGHLLPGDSLPVLGLLLAGWAVLVVPILPGLALDAPRRAWLIGMIRTIVRRTRGRCGTGATRS